MGFHKTESDPVPSLDRGEMTRGCLEMLDPRLLLPAVGITIICIGAAAALDKGVTILAKALGLK